MIDTIKEVEVIVELFTLSGAESVLDDFHVLILQFSEKSQYSLAVTRVLTFGFMDIVSKSFIISL